MPGAASVFVGANTTVAVGDYVAGANHTPLCVLDFMKRTSVV